MERGYPDPYYGPREIMIDSPRSDKNTPKGHPTGLEIRYKEFNGVVNRKPLDLRVDFIDL